jgi:hypothetical protein
VRKEGLIQDERNNLDKDEGDLCQGDFLYETGFPH